MFHTFIEIIGMKKILLSAYCLLLASFVFAQQKGHKIIFDFTKGDTASFSTIMRQINNITKAAPDSKLEIVCYGPGLDLLAKQTSTVQKQIEEFHGKYKVVFAACEASMQRRGIAKSELLPQVTTVPLASLEIASKQQEGWSYLKAGF